MQSSMKREFAIGFLEGFGFAGLFGNVGKRPSNRFTPQTPAVREESTSSGKSDCGLRS